MKAEIMYTITLELTEAEFMELATMAYCAGLNEPAAPPPLLTMLKKAENACLRQCNCKQFRLIEQLGEAVRRTCTEPSIERGMFMGGFEGLNDRLNDQLDQIQKDDVL